MSNPDNLLRPPVLNVTQNQPALNMNALGNEIRRIVSETIQEQAREIIQNIRNPPSPNEQDQIIEPQHRAQLGELDRVPDVVKCLREFSGQAGEYSSWRKSVERILGIYQHLVGTARYFGILSVVRNKIIGDADAILESYNTPLNWESITRCLTLHYADKRDVSTLEYQLTSLIQGTESVQEFYQRIYNHLSLILNKISCMDIGQESLNLLTKTYRDKALDTFIRGLKGDLPRLLAMREPADLPKALQLCLKLENQNFRTNYAQNMQNNVRKFNSGQQPPLPPKRSNEANKRRPFYPHLAFQTQQNLPTYFSPQNLQQPHQRYSFPQPNLNYNNHQPPPRPWMPKPQTRPEPMDVDQTVRTKNINYMNKPRPVNQFQGKRPMQPSFQAHQPQKLQRNFHTLAEQEQYFVNVEEQNNNQEQSLEEYVNNLPNYQQNDNLVEDCTDINFFRLSPSSLPYISCRLDDDKTIKVLLDTGSNKNYVQPNLIKNPRKNQEIFYANSVGGPVKITHHVYANLFGNNEIPIKFFLLPTLKSFDAIIGNDSLKQLSAVIHTEHNFMTIKGNKKIRIKQQISRDVNNIHIRTNHMTEKQKQAMQVLISKYHKLFLEPDEKLTYTSKVEAEIRTNTEQPIYTKSYPYPASLKDEVEKQLNELISNGIIRPSRSPYNAPVWIVPKKSDASGEKKFRMVMDYRKLNQVTIADRYPIPEINDMLTQLGNKKWFSVIDLKSGFHQIPLKSRDIEKTAFSVNNGKYEFLRLPFGLKNSPAIFQRTLDDILRQHIGKICFIYIDDILIFGENEEEHLKNVEKVFATLQESNMKVQLDKSEFFKEEVEFLGFVISKDGIKTNPKKLEAVKNFPQPRTVKDLRSFLGLSGFYRRFVKDYAKIAKPLTALLRGEDGHVPKNKSSKMLITLDNNAVDAFNKLKSTLTSRDVILSYPNFEKEFELTTDASNYAIGAVLSQDDRPIAFISRTLRKQEENYATNEREMLAIVWALENLRNYLYGSAKVKILTDHQPLTYALNNKNSNSKLRRWKAFIEEFNYELKYKPGKTNVVADALSRPPGINSLTSTQHSDESSAEDLIPFADAPINVFKNQILLRFDDTSTYKFEIVFPTYHRHTITQSVYSERDLIAILKRYLNPSVVNGISTNEETLGILQRIYPIHFRNYKVRFAREIVSDLTDEIAQENEILKEHKRAHRNSKENKIQLLKKFYFPGMQAKINNIVKQCSICKEQKYERHPNNPILKATPIPQHPGQIVHLDLFYTNHKVILTGIDKFSKYAQAKIVKSRAVVDIKEPLREIITSLGYPKQMVVDNEKSLAAASIRFMLEDQYGIEIYKAPPYVSAPNGQIERFHSTLNEIMRCTKAEKTHESFSDLLYQSLHKYNNSVHSTINRKPVEAFFSNRITTDPSKLEEIRINNIKKLEEKQEADLKHHNKNRKPYKHYSIGETVFVAISKHSRNKSAPRYKRVVVRENKPDVIITTNGKIVHKSLIRN